MFGKQGKVAKVNVAAPIMGKKPAGSVKGAGLVKQGVTVKPVAGSKNKLK
jgi:hypothetical protein